MFKKLFFSPLIISAFMFCYATSSLAEENASAVLASAKRECREGNYADASAKYRQAYLKLSSPVELLSEHLPQAVACLKKNNLIVEIDQFLEDVAARYPRSWRMLYAVADSYRTLEPYGELSSAGFFARGWTRRNVNSFKRDRVRILQLLTQAIKHSSAELPSAALSQLYIKLADTLLSSGEGFGFQAWPLLALSNLSTLPDYEEGRYQRRESRGAPVTADGKAIFFILPSSFEAAKNDGERYRWALAQAARIWPANTAQIKLSFARFLLESFGVRSIPSEEMRSLSANKEEAGESGSYALHTLSDSETIARLAIGTKRFSLPDEFNPLSILKNICQESSNDDGATQDACDLLASNYEDRRQYERASEVWRQNIKRFGVGADSSRQKRLDQIIGAWGRFEALQSQLSESEAELIYRFRNGKSVQFEAHEILVDKLLAKLKDFLKSNPKEIPYERLEINNIGRLLVEKDTSAFLGEKVASWTEKLSPLPHHFDRRVSLKAPLKKSGAYLISATIAGGNTSKIVLWLNDSVIVKKPLRDPRWLTIFCC